MEFKIRYLCIIILLASCSSNKNLDNPTQDEFYIGLTNTIAQSRKDEPFVISRIELENWFRPFPAGTIPRLFGENGVEIPLQSDDIDGDGIWDEISFVYSILPKYTASIKLETVEIALSSEFEKKTNIVVFHNIKDQKSGFRTTNGPERRVPAPVAGIAFENEKLVFVIHLLPQPLKMILGKNTNDMILNKIDIHSVSLPNQVWGTRLFSDIDSIGPAAISNIHEDLLHPIQTYDSIQYQILTQGPIRSSFKIVYHGVPFNNARFNLEEEITIWAGQDGYQNNIKILGDDSEKDLGVAVPFYGPASMVQSEQDAIHHVVAVHHIQDGIGSTAFGLLVPKTKMVDTDTLSLTKGPGLTFIKFQASRQNPVALRVYSGWHHQNEKFKDAEGFLNMLEKEGQRLSNPIEIAKVVNEDG